VGNWEGDLKVPGIGKTSTGLRITYPRIDNVKRRLDVKAKKEASLVFFFTASIRGTYVDLEEGRGVKPFNLVQRNGCLIKKVLGENGKVPPPFKLNRRSYATESLEGVYLKKIEKKKGTSSPRGGEGVALSYGSVRVRAVPLHRVQDSRKVRTGGTV